jgi:hypothetical protein
LFKPAEEWGKLYLDAVRALARIDLEVDPDELWDADQERKDAYAAVLAVADALHVHGFPEALDYHLFDDQRTVLHRLMSIMMGRPVAYRYDKVWQVINSMLTDTVPEAKSWHGLYLLAVKAREPSITVKQKERLAEWRSEVRASVTRGENTYRRDPHYDRLFALLFPELVPDLDNRRLKRATTPPERAAAGCDPDLIEPRFFEEPAAQLWTWTLSTVARVRELELAASRARIDGWSVDETCILHHLMREKYSSSYVSTMANIVGAKVGRDSAAVLRYLCRNGHIIIGGRQQLNP